MENNGNTPSTNDIPSINTIPDLPKVDLPQNDANAAPVQPPVEAVPEQQPSVPSAPSAYNYSTVAAPYQVQTVTKPKRSGGQIAALVFGILMTIVFGFLLFVLLLGDAVSGFTDPIFSVTIHGFNFIMLVLGIVLIVIGARKGKTAEVVNAAPVAQPYAAPVVPAAPVAQPYTAPVVPAAPVAQPYTAPVVPAAPVAQSYTAPVVPAAPVAQPYTAPASDVSSVESPVAQPFATPAPAVTDAVPAPVAPEAPLPASDSVPAAAPAVYNYAPTQLIGDDSKDVAKKSVRKAALVSMAILLGTWVVVLVLLFGFDYWIFPWYLLFFSAFSAIGAIKSYPKSVSAWLSLLLSVASIVLFFIINAQLTPYFE